MAANDIFIWDQEALDALPNGDVVVQYNDAVSPPEYTIRVSWTEPGEALNYTITIPVLGI
jgi:hypothetical protein